MSLSSTHLCKCVKKIVFDKFFTFKKKWCWEVFDTDNSHFSDLISIPVTDGDQYFY